MNNINDLDATAPGSTAPCDTCFGVVSLLFHWLPGVITYGYQDHDNRDNFTREEEVGSTSPGQHYRLGGQVETFRSRLR